MTKKVNVLITGHMVSRYVRGDVVPSTTFGDDLRRLLKLGVVEYTADDLRGAQPDEAPAADAAADPPELVTLRESHAELIEAYEQRGSQIQALAAERDKLKAEVEEVHKALEDATAPPPAGTAPAATGTPTAAK